MRVWYCCFKCLLDEVMLGCIILHKDHHFPQEAPSKVNVLFRHVKRSMRVSKLE